MNLSKILDNLPVALALGAIAAFALAGCPPAPPGDEPARGLPFRAVVWEEIQDAPGLLRFSRTRTPGGWVVATRHGDGSALVYVPDPDGAWLSTAAHVALAVELSDQVERR